MTSEYHRTASKDTPFFRAGRNWSVKYIARHRHTPIGENGFVPGTPNRLRWQAFRKEWGHDGVNPSAGGRLTPVQ